jgi:hypothetical protein
MTTPTVDIIIPVWNQPFETRACLVSILNTADSARLIIINNGCDRDTELLLEEFCEPLGNRVLYMTMERNIGFVPALNRGLARSDADWAMVIRSNGTVDGAWLQQLLNVAAHERAGIVSPLCTTETPLPKRLTKACCSQLETCQLSFAGMLLSRAMRDDIGCFDEELDGSAWCLRDYQQRAATRDYRTFLVPTALVHSAPPLVFGSEERRNERERLSQRTVLERWGTSQQFAVYFPQQTEPDHLKSALTVILAAARRGHRFSLLLHHRQYQQASKQGYRCLHTGIELISLARFGAGRDLRKWLQKLSAETPELSIVKGVDGIPVPGYDGTRQFSVIEDLLKGDADA